MLTGPGLCICLIDNVILDMTHNIARSRTKSSAPWKVSNSSPYLPPTNNTFFGNNSNGMARSKPVARDPRFSDLSGKLNVELFRKSYEFIDNLRDKEESALRQFIQKYNGKSKNKTTYLDQFGEITLEDAKKLLSKYKSQNIAIQNKREFAKLKQELKQKERLKLAISNKRTFYYSDAKIKKILKEKRDKEISINKIAKMEAKKAKKSIKSIPTRR